MSLSWTAWNSGVVSECCGFEGWRAGLDLLAVGLGLLKRGIDCLPAMAGNYLDIVEVENIGNQDEGI